MRCCHRHINFERKKITTILLFFTLILFLNTPSAQGSDFLVGFIDSFDPSEDYSSLKRVRAGLYEVKTEDIGLFRNHTAVVHIEPNHEIQLYQSSVDIPWQQWWADNDKGPDLDIKEIWQDTEVSNSVVVAIIDSGISHSHPELAENIWVNHAELSGLPGVDDDNNGLVDDIRGWSFYPNNNDSHDYRGHGTHVAGVIGGKGDNKQGISGIHWSTKMMAINVFPRYIEGRVSDAIRGIDYAVANGARVINASWGATVDEITKDEFQFLKTAIARAGEKGILFVAAAGNSGASNETNGDVPASFDLENILSVGAFDRYGRLADFSNFGPSSVDVLAPGVEIYSTLPKNSYGYKSGTSMAAPMVTGLASLLLSKDPKLTATELKEKIIKSCQPMLPLKDFSRCGGIVSARALLQLQNVQNQSQ